MNVDTGMSRQTLSDVVILTNSPIEDTQWAYLLGIRDFVLSKKDYIMTQVGNPDGADKPNKKVRSPQLKPSS